MSISSLTEQSLRLRLPTDWVRSRQRQIEQRMLAASAAFRESNFPALRTEDLRLLFQLYDAVFFQGAISARLCQTLSELDFRLGTRLTSVGAKTTLIRSRRRSRFEIAVSTRLLSQSFTQPGQTHWVAGLLCRTRLQALQRLMEHELIHVVELLVFGSSRCGRKRFKNLAANLFRHGCSHHQLVRPMHRTVEYPGFRIGDDVFFLYRGRQLQGRIYRITKRATIFVWDPNGRRQVDGRRYYKYLVPLERCQPCAG